MVDFLTISVRKKNNGPSEIYPKFIITKSNDLMIRGGDFYAIWLEELGSWSTDEQDAIALIDKELDIFANDFKEKYPFADYVVMYMRDAGTGVIDRWHKYCQKQMRDSYHTLDDKLIFSNDKARKRDYSSKRLTYPLTPCETPGYDALMSVLYSETERHKIEWAIGSIVAGDSKKIQKFLVLYGAAGTGKSTVLNIIQLLFDGYYCVFDAKALGSANGVFALEAFRQNPLVAIQHDGDLSRIEDNTRLNSLVSHEEMNVNEKFKSIYTNRFKAFLFMGTNKPVKITDGKSGILRRLIDVSPTGDTLPNKEYRQAVKQIPFELGGIACHCRDVYLDDPNAYDGYIPSIMMSASNDFYNYVEDSYPIFEASDCITLAQAWELYKTYCDNALVQNKMPQRAFKEELKNYFRSYKERIVDEDGTRRRNCYFGFKSEQFISSERSKKPKDISKNDTDDWLTFSKPNGKMALDIYAADCPAQGTKEDGTPLKRWASVTSKLSEIDVSQLHYVKVPEQLIVIDLDLKDSNGNKSLKENLRAARQFPPTYAELSKSGNAIHLHYIYDGDVSRLAKVVDEDIEIKVFTGNSALRRLLTKCNTLLIATISSGLPLKVLKGEKKMVNSTVVQSERGLRSLIMRNLRKEIHPATKPSMEFIKKILDDAYNSGLKYDVSDLKGAVTTFAANSTNNVDYCLKLIKDIHFQSQEPPEAETKSVDDSLIFFDCEVFPNLFVLNYKFRGLDKPVIRMINPTPTEVEDLFRYKLVGFNCRRYDNHILYARSLGYTNEKLFALSQQIVQTKKGMPSKGFFGSAYDISYTDIYDFASAGNKKSLKKLEIEMGIHHQELGLPWNEPVPEELWEKVAEYCDNDVIATEAAFNYLKGDWIAREILSDIAGMTPNDTTNNLSTRIIFGDNKRHNDEFNWRDLSLPVGSSEYEFYKLRFGKDYRFRVFNKDGLPEFRDYIPGEKLPKGWSILPFFPGYSREGGKSYYEGEVIGEGGRVYAEHGIWYNVKAFDVAGQHPSSIITEMLFGPKYTKNFKDIVDARVSIKHEEWDKIEHLFGGKLKPYIQKVKDGELTAKQLSNALKTVVNSVYGLTSAHFENVCFDPRNVDNIVAKRGALFMCVLTKEVQKRGYTVAHVKTDCIKIPNADKDIQDFVFDFGKEYGYTFEVESDFTKFCLVNDAVYVAKERSDNSWVAVGTQFQIPYVFKTLFSHEDILFEDLCETKEVKERSIYLDKNESNPDEHNYIFIGRVGSFCPIKPGCGGGLLLAHKDGEERYSAVTGTKGYRWLESETVRGREDIIDKSYYDALVADAIEAISKYGDFEDFVSDESSKDASFFVGRPPCNETYDTCFDCPHFDFDNHHSSCKIGYDISDYMANFNEMQPDGVEELPFD